jgi:tripartite-type tricarboxylate transporter receptor subunit TctC
MRLSKSPMTVERYAVAGLEPVSNTPEEFSDLIRREVPRWKKIAKQANIQID